MNGPSALGGILTPPNLVSVCQMANIDPFDVDRPYIAPEIVHFGTRFLARHIEHVRRVRVIHMSAARISMCCDLCNSVAARSLDNRKGVK